MTGALIVLGVVVLVAIVLPSSVVWLSGYTLRASEGERHLLSDAALRDGLKGGR